MLPNEHSTPRFRHLHNVLTAVGAGHPVIVIDDVHGIHDGALVFAAEHATSKLLSFVVRHSCGFVCAALPGPDCERLALPLLPGSTDAPEREAHCVTVDLCGTGTGISAAARAQTIAALAAASSVPEDFTRPGHVVPIRAHPGGVLERSGYAEAAVDLARLAGHRPAGAFAGIVSDTWPQDIARKPELTQFAVAHGLAVVSLTELAEYRRLTEPQLVRGKETVLPTERSSVHAVEFHATHSDIDVLTLVTGEISGQHNVLVRVHQECFTGTLMGASAECGCGLALGEATRSVAEEGRGVVVRVRSRGNEWGCGPEIQSPAINALADEAVRALGVVSIRSLPLAETA